MLVNCLYSCVFYIIMKYVKNVVVPYILRWSEYYLCDN